MTTGRPPKTKQVRRNHTHFTDLEAMWETATVQVGVLGGREAVSTSDWQERNRQRGGSGVVAEGQFSFLLPRCYRRLQAEKGGVTVLVTSRISLGRSSTSNDG
ncbi:conserved hypothetical protein [Ricinus communis]|uniref:Uncharacterized protein n=1 Tax=Ricinus communis TaxID=3988 RepID=B9SAC1_RICCO|nr:conserved hypothetical protein [Ricinus communis]